MRRSVLLLVVVVALVACDDRTAGDGAAPVAPTPDVLTVEPAVVEPGDEVTVTFDPPEALIWGVAGELWSIDLGERIAFTYGWAGRPRMKTIWPAPGGAFEDIGFSGRASWTWTVPGRLEPGTYELRKDVIADEPGELEDRTQTWTARFEVR